MRYDNTKPPRLSIANRIKDPPFFKRRVSVFTVLFRKPLGRGRIIGLRRRFGRGLGLGLRLGCGSGLRLWFGLGCGLRLGLR